MSEAKTARDKKVFYFVLALSVVVFVVVLVLNRKLITPPEKIPSIVYYLPAFNAFLNGICSVLLITSFAFIRRKQVAIHKRLNLTAFVLSALFLISYITFHFFAPETKFPATNSLRPVYLTILASHIVLAALVLPLVLLSFYHGLQNNVDKHRKLVRFSFPIWLYVTITGVIVYLMISPYYSF